MKQDGPAKYRQIPLFFVKSARAILGLTQDGLAEALGVPRWAVANWESGRAIPKATVIIAIRKLLKLHEGNQGRGKRHALSANRKQDMVR
jgi:DNA-binding XRE family transcriptional regulator